MAKDWKDNSRAYMRDYYQKHKEEMKAYSKSYYKEHKEDHKSSIRANVNSLGRTKHSVRVKSRRYLLKHGTKIPGYQIHHCCTYTEPYKFIYCSREKHLEIHRYLSDNHIKADTDHYEQIKHLLDDTVILYGVE